MDGMLSQDEINALLNGMNSDDSSDDNADSAAQDSSMAGDNNTNMIFQILRKSFLITKRMQLVKYPI